ncbi:cytochrome P450 family protein [Exophiala viscosa]|uniref:cytochrome P450 family protein n=1 Tax=Exophiala viscosa TaxID=2486360 RepID=UPI002197BD0F|nr:cytochrome P450 family protein [Exophiala viscosa]
MAFIVGLVVLVTLISYKIFSSIRLRRHNAEQAALRGCQEPAKAPRKGLLGTGMLVESIRATREEWGPVWMHQTLNSIGKTNHTVKASVADFDLIITRDTENIKAMFATQSQDFDIGTHRENAFKSLLGLGVMTTRQERWKHSRALVRPQFTRDNLADLDLFQRHLDALLQRIPRMEDGWTAKVDLSPLFFNFTLDTGSEFLFGQSVHSQTPEKTPAMWDADAPDLRNFGHHLDKAKHMIDRRGALTKYGWLLRDSSFPKHCKAVQDCVDWFVKQRLNRGSDDEKVIETPSGKPKFVLLDELAKDTSDPLELRCELLNILHASRDTTASLMGWSFYFLARYPDVFKTLREEIIDNFTANPESEITFNKLWACQYLQYVVKETIRVVGVVPMNERAATCDTTLPRGGGADGLSPVFVPKGTQVLIPTYSMQHREDIWGPDVDEYKPERWQDRKFGWDFIPFGGGVRQCLGQQFARTETMYVLARALQIFDQIENMEGPGPVKMHHTIENRSGTGVQVRLHLASAESKHCREQPTSELKLGPEYDLGLGADRPMVAPPTTPAAYCRDEERQYELKLSKDYDLELGADRPEEAMVV